MSKLTSPVQGHVTGMCLALALLFVLPSSGAAAEFYAIVDNLGRRPINAYLDVAVDAASGGIAAPEVLFRAYDEVGSQLAEYLATSQNGFVSTFSAGNLFELGAGQPMLVRGSTPGLAADAGAVLHLEVKGAHVAVGVLHKNKLDGTTYGSGRVFAVPLGSFRKASLLIANVSGSDVSVESFKGALQAAGSGTPLNLRLPSNGVLKVDLAQTDAFSNYIVSSTGLVIVQAVFDDGRMIQSYMVPPSS